MNDGNEVSRETETERRQMTQSRFGNIVLMSSPRLKGSWGRFRNDLLSSGA